jgi:hypothetical protein
MFGLALVVAGAVGSLPVQKPLHGGAAPVATDPLAGEITGTSAVIEWTTDEPMTGEVQFGLDNLYGTVAGSGGTADLDHVVLLAGLTPATFYHFRVKNHSAGGETVYSFDRTFQTPAAGG